MTIEFGPLAAADTSLVLDARMRLAGALLGFPLEAGECAFLGRMRPRLVAGGIEADDGGPVVVVPSAAELPIAIGGQFAASVDVTMQINGQIALRPTMYGGNVTAGDTQAYFVGRAEVGTTGFAEVPPAEAFGFMLAPNPHLKIYGGITFERAAELIEARLESDSIPMIGMRDRFEVLFSGQTELEGLASVMDGVSFADAMAVVLRELVESGFEFGASVTDNYTAIGRVTDALRMLGAASTQLEARNIITVALAMQVLVDMFAKEQLIDTVAFNAAAADVLVAMQQLVDTIEAAGAAEAVATLGVLVTDTVAADDAAATALEAHTAIRDSIAFSLRLSLDSGEYVAYVMNTTTKGLTSYEGYRFNSFARFGDAEYGMTPEGVRRLGGPDDDGEAINSRFRLAFTNLGSGVLKRMRVAYLGLTSTGDLRLKVIIVNPKDKKREAHYYRLRATPSDGPVPVRMMIGEGLRTVYWGFEVESIDGAQWVIDQMQLFPVMLEQRMDGEGGGKR